MIKYMKVIAGVVLLLTLLAILLGPLAVTKVEPLYTVKNQDLSPHNVTIEVAGSDEEYTEITNYELNPGESADVEKPLILLLKWSNPFKEGYLYHASGEYLFILESENRSVVYHHVPHKSGTVVFELKNESGNLTISVTESDELHQQLRKNPLDFLTGK